MLSDKIKEIKEHIRLGKTQLAIEAFKHLIDKDRNITQSFETKLTLISARFFSEKKNYTVGTISNEAFAQVEQQVNQAILVFCEALKNLGHDSQNIELPNVIKAYPQQEHAGSGDNIGKDKIINNYYQNNKTSVPKDLTASILPPIDSSKVFGRKTDLAHLTSVLNSSSQVAIVNGLGGIGKSTLARLYLKENIDKFDHIAWFAFTKTSFKELITTSILPESLGIDRKRVTSEQLLSLIFQKLKELPGHNLLVIDNADQTDEINKYRNFLPQGYTNWKVLITSRGTIDGFKQVPINTVSLNNAKALFLAHYPAGSKEPKALIELLQLVGLHTLTIELMAKTIAKSRRLKSVAELLEKVKDKKYEDSTLLKEVYVEHKDKWLIGSGEEEKGKIKGIYQYLLAVFDLANLNLNEPWVMKLLAMFPSKPLNTDAFFEITGLNREENKILADNVDNCIDSLIENGWLQSQKPADNSETIFLHSILKELILFKLKPNFNDCKVLIYGYLNFASIEMITKEIVEKLPYIDLGESLLAYFTIISGKISSEPFFNYKATLSRLNKVVGHLLQYQGNYQKTLHYYKKALSLAHELSPQNDKELFEKEALIISHQGSLGTIYENIGDYEKAQTLFENVLSKAKTLYGSEAFEVAHHLSNLGLLYREKDNFVKAKIYLEQSLKIRQKHFDIDNFNYAVNLANLGLVYHNLLEQEKAKSLLEPALKYHKQHLSPDAPDVATVQSNLSTVYSALNEFDKALVAINDSLRIDLKNFGERHPHTAGRYLTRGSIYFLKGMKKEAEADFKEALRLYLITLGEEHPYVQNTREFIDEVNSERYERLTNRFKLLNKTK